MRRINLVCTLLGLVCAVLGSCAPQSGPTPTPVSGPAPGPVSPAATAALNTYHDPDGYFTIDYPPDWEVLASELQVEFRAPYAQVHILVQYADAGQVLHEAQMRELIDTYFAVAEIEGVSGFHWEKETVQDDGGIWLEYSFVTAGVTGYGSSLFQQQGTVIYILSYWVGRQELWPVNQALFDTVAGSFVLTPPSN